MQNKDLLKDDELKRKKQPKEEVVNNNASRIFDEVLLEGEKIKMSLKPTAWKVYINKMFKPFCLYLFFVAMFVVTYLNPSKSMTKEDSLIFLYVVSALTVVLEVIVVLITKKGLKNVYYIVTNKRVVLSDGVFSVNFKSLNLDKVKDIYLNWSLVDKLFMKKNGQIVFYPTSKEFGVVQFYCINKPTDVYIEIQELLENLK